MTKWKSNKISTEGILTRETLENAVKQAYEDFGKVDLNISTVPLKDLEILNQPLPQESFEEQELKKTERAKRTLNLMFELERQCISYRTDYHEDFGYSVYAVDNIKNNYTNYCTYSFLDDALKEILDQIQEDNDEWS